MRSVPLCDVFVHRYGKTCVWHTFSAFWLWSSVVSVLISMTTDMFRHRSELLLSRNFFLVMSLSKLASSWHRRHSSFALLLERRDQPHDREKTADFGWSHVPILGRELLELYISIDITTTLPLHECTAFGQFFSNGFRKYYDTRVLCSTVNMWEIWSANSEHDVRASRALE